MVVGGASHNRNMVLAFSSKYLWLKMFVDINDMPNKEKIYRISIALSLTFGPVEDVQMFSCIVVTSRFANS